MAEETLTYNLEADASKMIASVSAASSALDSLDASVEDVTKSNAALAASWISAGKATAKADDEVRKATRDLAKMDDAAKDASKGADRLGRNMDGLDKILNKMGVTGVVGDVKDMREGFIMLSPALQASAAAMGVVGAGLAAATAYAGAVVGTAAAITSLAMSAADAAKETDHLSQIIPIDKAKIEASKELNAAFAAMGDLVDRVGADIGAEFAPALKDVATDFVALGLMAVDAWQVIIKGAEATAKAFNMVVNMALSPMDTAWRLFATGLITSVEFMMGLVGMELPDSFARVREEIGKQVVETNVLSGAFEGLANFTSEYRTEAEGVVSTQLKMSDAKDNTTRATKELTEAEREALAVQAEAKKVAEDRARSEMSALSLIMGESKKLADSKLSEHDKEVQAIQRDIAALEAARDAVGDNAVAHEMATQVIEAKREELQKLQKAEEDVADASVNAATTAKSAWKDYWRSFSEGAEMTGAEVVASFVDAGLQVADYAAQMVTDYLDKQEERRQADAEARAERIAGLQEERDAAKAAYEDEAAAYQAAQGKMTEGERAKAEAVLAMKESASESSQKILLNEQKAARDAAKKDWVKSKRQALVKVLMDQGLAAARTLAQFGPPIPPNFAGIAAMGSAAAIGTMAIAQVAAQRPPSFHRGAGPDEIRANIQANEAVLNPTGVAAAGGNEAIEALNRGMSMSSGQSQSAIYLNDRLIDVIGSSIMNRQSPGLRVATGASRPGSGTGY